MIGAQISKDKKLPWFKIQRQRINVKVFPDARRETIAINWLDIPQVTKLDFSYVRALLCRYVSMSGIGFLPLGLRDTLLPDCLTEILPPYPTAGP